MEKSKTNYMEIGKYMESIKMNRFIYKIVGNGWEMVGKWLGVSNLCAPLRGIPGRGLFCPQKSVPLHKKYFFACFYDKPPYNKKARPIILPCIARTSRLCAAVVIGQNKEK